MQHLTPRQIIAELDKYIVGQSDAKRAVAVAVRNRWRRQQLPEALRGDVSPKNILMMGPTGVGKTEIARRLAGLTGAPFIKVEATKYTEVGYHGRDVESMVRDLLDSSIQMVRNEMTESVKEPAEHHVEDRLLEYLLPAGVPASSNMSSTEASTEPDETEQRHARTREKLREQLRSGALEDRMLEITVEERSSVVGVLGQAGMEMDIEFHNMFEQQPAAKRGARKMAGRDARKILFAQEAEEVGEKDWVNKPGPEGGEQEGNIF